MARPMKFDREKAIEIASEAVQTNGYRQSSVKALSEQLGISRSSFYNTFGSREALFAEIIESYAPSAPDAPLYERLDGPVLPLLERVLRNLCDVRSADQQGRGCIIVNSICELCPSDNAPATLLAQMARDSAVRIQELLAIAQARREISPDANVHALALALQNLMTGLNVLSKVVRSQDELWLLTQATLNGLGLLSKTTDDGTDHKSDGPSRELAHR